MENNEDYVSWQTKARHEASSPILISKTYSTPVRALLLGHRRPDRRPCPPLNRDYNYDYIRGGVFNDTLVNSAFRSIATGAGSATGRSFGKSRHRAEVR